MFHLPQSGGLSGLGVVRWVSYGAPAAYRQAPKSDTLLGARIPVRRRATTGMISDTMTPDTEISGTIVDVVAGRIYSGRIVIRAGRIAALEPTSSAGRATILPGFVDAHVHVESAMLTPGEFARAAVCHGTVAAVADPHEMANVLGVAGIRYLIDEAAHTPFVFGWGAPPCVPATPFETAGAELTAEDVAGLLDWPEITHLAEVMNVPGVLNGDPQLLAKLAAARQRGKPVDGHAPGLRGADLRRYAAAGITTDHETLDRAEGEDKLAAGLYLQIRSGSAAALVEPLLDLLDAHPEACMFCSDDLHPDDLQRGHIDRLVRAALRRGIAPLKVLRAASLNPVRHYQLPVGLLQPGDPADFIVVDNLADLRVRQTWLRGRLVAEEGRTLLPFRAAAVVNRFAPRGLAAADLALPWRPGQAARVIEIRAGQLVTGAAHAVPAVHQGLLAADPARDLLKLVVLNRYHAAPPAQALVRGLGLQRGALASSVAHDCHNVIAAGTSDALLADAIRAVVEAGGGLAVADGHRVQLLPLPVAGLLSTESCDHVAARYTALDEAVKLLGCPLRAPFMTLSFLALPVIPHLKLTDRGLFDGDAFRFVPLCGHNENCRHGAEND